MKLSTRALILVLIGHLPMAAGIGQSVDLDQRIDAVRASTAEERWRRIPFGRSLTAALEEAGRTGKPVFHFAGDGNVDSGNC